MMFDFAKSIVIKDTCRCGAIFSIDGDEIFAKYQHKDWLKAHAVCRHNVYKPKPNRAKEKL